MKNVLIISAMVILTAVGLFFLIPDNKSSDTDTNNSNTEQASKGESITSEINSGKAVMYDVRTPAEYDASHSSLAQNFDSVQITAGNYPQVSKDQKIYIYCRSGSRATQVKAILEKNGYKDIVNLGSLTNMKQLGLL